MSQRRGRQKRAAQTDFSSEFQEKHKRLAEAFRGSQHEYVTIRPLWLDVLISVAVAGLIGTAIYFVLRATGLLQSFQKRQRREKANAFNAAQDHPLATGDDRTIPASRKARGFENTAQAVASIWSVRRDRHICRPCAWTQGDDQMDRKMSQSPAASNGSCGTHSPVTIAATGAAALRAQLWPASTA